MFPRKLCFCKFCLKSHLFQSTRKYDKKTRLRRRRGDNKEVHCLDNVGARARGAVTRRLLFVRARAGYGYMDAVAVVQRKPRQVFGPLQDACTLDIPIVKLLGVKFPAPLNLNVAILMLQRDSRSLHLLS